MVKATILFDGKECKVDPCDIMVAITLKSADENRVEMGVVSMGNREGLHIADMFRGLATGLVEAVSDMATNDIAAAIALKQLSDEVEKAAKAKSLERLSR